MLASLNHTDIAAIYGLEESPVAAADAAAAMGAGVVVRALVLEFVDGPTLAERLSSVAYQSQTRSTSLARLPTRSKPRTGEESRFGLAEHDGDPSGGMFERREKRTDVQLESAQPLPVPRAAKAYDLRVALVDQAECAIECLEAPARLEIADDDGIGSLVIAGNILEILKGGVRHKKRRAEIFTQEPGRRGSRRAE